MRTDFAEERRWKTVEAREMVYQIVEWHLSKNKADLMVGGRSWGACNSVPILGHSESAQHSDPPGIAVEDVEMPDNKALEIGFKW